MLGRNPAKELLEKLEISKDDYYRAFSTTKDEDLELHLKREANSCFVINYFDVGLKTWQETYNLLLMSRAVAYMCQYFSKTECRCTQAMKQTAKEVFENKMDHHDTMKTVAKAYLSNRGCFLQEAVYPVLAELKVSRIFHAVYFVNTNPPDERVQVLLSEKQLSKPSGNSPNIFKESNIDCYMKRPSAKFCDGIYSILDDFCYAVFLACYTLEIK